MIGITMKEEISMKHKAVIFISFPWAHSVPATHAHTCSSLNSYDFNISSFTFIFTLTFTSASAQFAND